MSPVQDSERSLEAILDGAVRREERAVLQLSRRVASLLEQYGAYSVRKDWSRPTREITLQIARTWREAGRVPAQQHLEGIVKNRFWEAILEQMTEGNSAASNVFFPTVRRLLARWDGRQSHAAAWDDIAQDTAHQLWERWRAGGVDRPWSLLCTIAKRRYLDVVRGTKATDELTENSLGETAEDDAGGEIFTEQALAVLEADEREIILRMDLQGQTRVEIAHELGLTEGQVLSVRRAGLRRIWRWLGRDLPPRIREVWEEMFKGAKRAGPDDVARKLGLEVEEVIERIAHARQLIGVG